MFAQTSWTPVVKKSNAFGVQGVVGNKRCALIRKGENLGEMFNFGKAGSPFGTSKFK